MKKGKKRGKKGVFFMAQEGAGRDTESTLLISMPSLCQRYSHTQTKSKPRPKNFILQFLPPLSLFASRSTKTLLPAPPKNRGAKGRGLPFLSQNPLSISMPSGLLSGMPESDYTRRDIYLFFFFLFPFLRIFNPSLSRLPFNKPPPPPK